MTFRKTHNEIPLDLVDEAAKVMDKCHDRKLELARDIVIIVLPVTIKNPG